MGDLALKVLRADLVILSVLFTDRLKWPLDRIMAVEALDAVLVAMTSLVLLVSDAHLLAVTTLALARYRA